MNGHNTSNVSANASTRARSVERERRPGDAYFATGASGGTATTSRVGTTARLRTADSGRTAATVAVRPVDMHAN